MTDWTAGDPNRLGRKKAQKEVARDCPAAVAPIGAATIPPETAVLFEPLGGENTFGVRPAAGRTCNFRSLESLTTDL